MSTAIVVGAGMAGCVVARMLAEQGIPVTLYEQSGHVGGILRTLPDATIANTDQGVTSWLLARIELTKTANGELCATRGYGRMCEDLVKHKGVSIMKHCTITDIEVARSISPYVISCVSPDRVLHSRFGELPWANGKPVYTQESMQQYHAYARLLGLSSIFSCGSLATFAVLSIPQIIRQAMTVTEAIACPQNVVTPTR